ncbi:MAG: DUF2071 domain-containing protein [Deltaproteobacteria bacterium]|nr:DUF2071 domain-containing protein [Deltaproteobacteria bacterium]
MAVHSMDSPVISHSPAHVHHWRDLAFLHWRVPEAALRPLVPSALEIDTFDGSAWIGLVLFTMPRVRIRG